MKPPVLTTISENPEISEIPETLNQELAYKVINVLTEKITSEELHSGKMFQIKNFDDYFIVEEDSSGKTISLNERGEEEYESLKKYNAFILVANSYDIGMCFTNKFTKCNMQYNTSHSHNEFVLPNSNQEAYIKEFLNTNKPNKAQGREANIYNKFLHSLKEIVEKIKLFKKRKNALNNFIQDITEYNGDIESEMIGNAKNKFGFLYERYQIELGKGKGFQELKYTKPSSVIELTKEKTDRSLLIGPKEEESFAMQKELNHFTEYFEDAFSKTLKTYVDDLLDPSEKKNAITKIRQTLGYFSGKIKDGQMNNQYNGLFEKHMLDKILMRVNEDGESLNFSFSISFDKGKYCQHILDYPFNMQVITLTTLSI